MYEPIVSLVKIDKRCLHRDAAWNVDKMMKLDLYDDSIGWKAIFEQIDIELLCEYMNLESMHVTKFYYDSICNEVNGIYGALEVNGVRVSKVDNSPYLIASGNNSKSWKIPIVFV